MNKIFRLIYTLLFSRYRPKVNYDGICETPFRVLPNDLDLNLHMNNGVYFSLQDLARIDLMIRCGLLPVLNKNGWYPVITSETLKFRRSLKPWQKFIIRSQLLGWTDKAFVLQHHHLAGGNECASGIITARFLKKSGGSVTPKEIMKAAGFPEESPRISEHIVSLVNSL